MANQTGIPAASGTPPKTKARLFDFNVQVTAASYDEAHMLLHDALSQTQNVEVMDGTENYTSKQKAVDRKLGIKPGKKEPGPV